MLRTGYNLITQPWVPCRAGDGTTLELGLRDVLIRAPALAAVEGDSPVVTGALMRLLLALLHDILRGPATRSERLELWLQPEFEPGPIDAYFDRWADRFDLFSAERPFAQIAGFDVGKADPITRLGPGLASGNNVTLFDHTLDSEPQPVPAAVAARWLLAHQLFGLGGGQGPSSARFGKHPYASHAPAVLGANVFLTGRSLRETLLLNLLPCGPTVHPVEALELGEPFWRREPPESLEPRYAVGYLDWLCWLNRCVLLVPEPGSAGPTVRWVHTAQGVNLPKEHEYRDPFFAVRNTDTGSFPLRFSAGRALWRDSTALLGWKPDDTKRLGQRPRPTVLYEAGNLLAELRQRTGAVPETFDVLVIGLDFEQSKIDLWRAEALPVPRAALEKGDAAERLVADIGSAVKEAENRKDALRAALRRLAELLLEPDSDLPGSERRADPKAVSALVDSWQAVPLYWAALDAPFRKLLRDLPTGGDDAQKAWTLALEQAAEDAFRAAEAAAGDSGRAWKARVRGRAAVTSHWTFWPKQKKGALA